MGTPRANLNWLIKNPDYNKEWRAAHPEYGCWKSMIQRCTNPNVAGWDKYGGRGITVDERWTSFESFLKDVGPRPTLHHSIDRVDNNLGYAPGNVRWATRSEQQRNKRSTYSSAAVGFIRELVATGESWRGIAMRLNESDINPPRARRWYGVTAKDCFVRAALEAE